MVPVLLWRKLPALFNPAMPSIISAILVDLGTTHVEVKLDAWLCVKEVFSCDRNV